MGISNIYEIFEIIVVRLLRFPNEIEITFTFHFLWVVLGGDSRCPFVTRLKLMEFRKIKINKIKKILNGDMIWRPSLMMWVSRTEKIIPAQNKRPTAQWTRGVYIGVSLHLFKDFSLACMAHVQGLSTRSPMWCFGRRHSLWVYTTDNYASRVFGNKCWDN